MIPKFRSWDGAEMYDEPVIHNGELYLDWRDFIDGNSYDGAALMQSTGLKDKNGVEIFEGDIVEVGGELLEACFHSAFGVFFKKGNEVNFSEVQSLEEAEEAIEGVKFSSLVIGNIYENPELMKEQ